MREPEKSGGEAGFTLIETLTAMIVLSFGLIGVINLFLVASASNVTASQTTAAANLASEQLDALRTAPYNDLVVGGTVGAECAGCGFADPYVPPVTVPPTPGCPGGPANHSCTQVVPGIGNVQVSWRVDDLGPNGRGITVEALPLNGLARGWSRVTLTTLRTCTAPPPAGAAAGAGPCALIVAP